MSMRASKFLDPVSLLLQRGQSVCSVIPLSEHVPAVTRASIVIACGALAGMLGTANLKGS